MSLAIDSQETGTGSAGGGLGHAASAAGGGTATSLSWSFTNNAGNIIYIGTALISYAGVTTADPSITVQYGSGTASLVGSIGYGTGGTDNTTGQVYWVYLYALTSPATGSNTVTITINSWTGSTTWNIFGSAISFSGASGTVSSNWSSSYNDTGSTTTPSTTLSSTTNGNYVVGFCTTGSGFSSATSPTLMSASYNLDQDTGGSNMALSDQATSGGSQTVAFTTINDWYGMVVAEVAAGAGATNYNYYLPLLGVA